MLVSAEISTVQYSSFRIPMYVLYWVCHVDCKYIQWNYSGINDLRHMRPAHSIFCFSFFGQSDQKWEKSTVMFVYFLYKKSTFCMKMTAIFFRFLVKVTKTEKTKNGMNPTMEKLYIRFTVSKTLELHLFHCNSTVYICSVVQCKAAMRKINYLQWKTRSSTLINGRNTCLKYFFVAN